VSSDFRAKKIFGKFMHVSDIPLGTKSGKPLVFFLGAGFCPFCAAERWSVAEALKNFGSWQRLPEDYSAERDEKYLNLPTLNLATALYSSEFIEFLSIETADRNFNPIENANDDPYGLIENHNPDQIVPFTLVDGQFMQAGTGYSPKLLEGLNHMKVREQILDPQSALGSSIKTEANFITALICFVLRNTMIPSTCNEDHIKVLLDQILAK